jgi:cell division protease FtsH
MKKINMKQFKGPGNILLMAAFLSMALLAVSKLADFSQRTENINYSTFIKKLQNNQVQSVEVNGSDVRGVYRGGGSSFETTIPNTPEVWELLKQHNVETSIGSTNSGGGFWSAVFLLLLTLGLVGLVIWYFRQGRNNGGASGGNIFSMSKSKARMFMPSQIKANFNTVAGAVEAKEELSDIIDFLKNPDKFKRLGAKLTKGVLLVGEPGNGKTLLAKAVAGEANCPFFSVSGSDFIEVFVGVGAARVRDLFAQARRHSPSIIFIDEIDAVGRQRGAGLGGGHDEREQTLNQLLIEMDGFESGNSSVVIIAATNRPDVLDKALLRPGRFDRRVNVPYPDLNSRKEILKVHSQKVPLADDIDLTRIARGTPGFTGADLANLINEAAISATKNDTLKVTADDFENARDKIVLGKEMRTMVLTEEERKVTAYHEAGHALVTLLTPEETDPLHKVTIMPRSRALGVTWSLPEREKHTISKDEMIARIMVALGGRAAEELVFNRLESGAHSDFATATKVARAMVCSYGMSKKLGPLVYEQNRMGENNYSEETARTIDDEMRSILDGCYQHVLKLLSDNRDKLEKLANALIEEETMYAGEIYQLLGIKPRTEHLFH